MSVTDTPTIDPAATTVRFSLRPAPSGRWPRTQFLQLRCGGCRHLFEAETPIHCAVEEWVEAVQALVCPACGGTRILVGQGRTLAEDAAYPRGVSLAEREAHWLADGEHGEASTALFERLSGRAQSSDAGPRDLGSLVTCLLLLDRFPEWRGRIDEMAAVSEHWARLAPAWASIEAGCFAELGPGLEGRSAPRTSTRLEELSRHPDQGSETP